MDEDRKRLSRNQKHGFAKVFFIPGNTMLYFMGMTGNKE